MKPLNHMRTRSGILRALLLSVLLVLTAFGQKGTQSGSQANQQGNQGTQGSQNSQGGGQGLPRFSYAPDEWRLLDLPDVKGPIRTFLGRTVLCYKLTKSNSATQPLILQRLQVPNEVVGTGFDLPCGKGGKGETDAEGRKECGSQATEDTRWSACSPLDEKHALLMGQELVIGI